MTGSQCSIKYRGSCTVCGRQAIPLSQRNYIARSQWYDIWHLCVWRWSLVLRTADWVSPKSNRLQKTSCGQCLQATIILCRLKTMIPVRDWNLKIKRGLPSSKIMRWIRGRETTSQQKETKEFLSLSFYSWSFKIQHEIWNQTDHIRHCLDCQSDIYWLNTSIRKLLLFQKCYGLWNIETDFLYFAVLNWTLLLLIHRFSESIVQVYSHQQKVWFLKLTINQPYFYLTMNSHSWWCLTIEIDQFQRSLCVYRRSVETTRVTWLS